MMYKTYKKQRYLFFWAALLVYFVPYISVTAALLPFMKINEGARVGIGIVVVAINVMPFVGGIMKGFRAHFPFFNTTAFLFVMLSSFFTLDAFSNYVYTFTTIECTAFIGCILSCLFWGLYLKYKRKAQTVSTVIKSGILGGE